MPRDPQGRHIRVYCSLLDSTAWRTLGWSARALFVDLRATVTGTNNGNLAATLSLLKHRGWTSSSTLSSAIYELRALGFLAVTREGGLRQGTRVPTLYRFTDLDVYEQPKVEVASCKATHDYARSKSLAEARAMLAAGVAELRAKGKAKQKAAKLPVRRLNPIDSKSAAETRFIDSEPEQGDPSSLRYPNRDKRSMSPREVA